MAETSLRSLRGGKLLIVSLAVVGGLLILGRLLSELYVDLLWYRSTGYTPVFLRRVTWLWGIRAFWGLVVVVALVASLRLVARTLAGIQIKRRFGNLEISEQLPRTYVWWGIVGVSLLMGAWFGGSIREPVAWAVMAALQQVEWGLVEPVLGRDVSYYVFSLPLLGTVVGYLMVLVFLVFTMSTAGYAATGAVRWGRGGIIMGHQPRIHLGALVATFLALMAVRFWLSRPGLLLSGESAVTTSWGASIFGYADAEARLPALRLMTGVTLFAAAALMWGVWRNRLIPVVAALGSVVIGSLVVLQFYPSLVQRFRVAPNELEWETPYIEHNLHFTRLGFALSELERGVFRVQSGDSTDWGMARTQFVGLPVWHSETLKTTFQATESRFAYYQFQTADFTRYALEDGRQIPVAISVREIDPLPLQDESWQNLHLRDLYIQGRGAVAVAASERTPEGRPPMYLYGNPPEFTSGPAPQGLRLSRPSVYFGSRSESGSQEYVIVNAAAPGAAGENVEGTAGVDFPEGIPLDSPLKKLTLAWRFRDPNLLFTSQISDSSRLVFLRNVVARAQEIAPFFRYDAVPYPVIVDGRIFWILEGFTATRQFPLSSAVDPETPPRGRQVSYLRNSLKVTVDAVTGDTRFYALPESDPLRDAYARAFPGLLRPLDQMPEGLRAHLRYSKTMLATQAAVLQEYHQETAPRFHGRQDVWTAPEEYFQSTTPERYTPEFGIYKLPGEERPTFNLTTAFVPAGRQNLAALLVGRVEPDGGARLSLYDIPVEDQALGPHQVEALVEQEPEISQQFALWRGAGSQVWTGRLHIVPVGTRLFYMEPVLLAATDNAIPELRRFVVSDGRRVSMAPTLDEAIAALAGDAPPGPRMEDVEGRGFTAPQDTSGWPREALELLDLAERRLRGGDWTGFGVALEELRRLLERITPPGGA
jgi:uncharacterized membrane protein (UPF0182 family)